MSWSQELESRWQVNDPEKLLISVTYRYLGANPSPGTNHGNNLRGSLFGCVLIVATNWQPRQQKPNEAAAHDYKNLRKFPDTRVPFDLRPHNGAACRAGEAGAQATVQSERISSLM